MTAGKTLREHAEEYLAMRRALGFSLTTFGIRLTGMPSYNHILNDTQIWQVSLLLKNADQQLPDPVMKILTQP